MINYLLDPFIQIENNNGQPIVGAKIYVYYTGSRTVAPIYSNKSGTSLANPAITDTLGNVTIFAETGTFYDVLVYDNDGTLLFSKLNVTPSDSTAADIREVDIEAGFGIQVHKRYRGNKAIYNVAIDPDEAATQADVSGKQDKLIAGANIEITPNNTINVVQRKTLYTQWPLKVDRDSSMLKLYLDQDFVGNTMEIMPGADLIANYDEYGHKIIGVDTNTSANGEYNFYAGYDNEISGNYSTVFGKGNIISGDYNTIIGKYANKGDYLFAVGNGYNENYRNNAFEVRKDGNSYYKYNGSLYQLKPPSPTRTTFDKTLTTTYTVQSNNEHITIPLTEAIEEYTTWHNTNRNKLTSPTYMFLELRTDTQVDTAGMIYVNMYYNGISTAEPILVGNVYIDKFWSGLSMAYCNGVIPSNTNLQNSYWWLELRNISTGTKWLANTVITVKIRFIGTAITYS